MPTPDLRHRRSLAGLIFIVACMTGLALGSSPFYRLFCSATGLGGTTRVAASAPQTPGAVRLMTVRFNADVAEGLAWDFAPDQAQVTIKVGESKRISYHAQNRSNRTITARAIYNVTPDKAGPYFDKIQCFCFNQQTLKPGEKAEFPVTFFVDPDLLKDPGMSDVTTITLSYTFFEARDGS